MILPVVAYGDPVLKKRAVNIKKDYPELTELIADMFETMYASHGVGLAAPQIGKSIRLFVVDGKPFEEDEIKDFRKVFINAQVKEEQGEPWKFNEGCLSIPGIREDVNRKEHIYLEYYDEEWNQKKEIFTGLAARIIQHEYDHIEGILFIDRISPFRKKMIRGKLQDITKGIVDVDYKMKFHVKK